MLATINNISIINLDARLSLAISPLTLENAHRCEA
jgi:hypothetical protein